MSDAIPTDNSAILPSFLRRKPIDAMVPSEEAIASLQPHPEDKKKRRFGRFLVNVATSKKTHDFLLGAAISGGTSYAVRAGVVAAAATVGAAAIPTAILAAGAAGLATGGVRYYLDYKKAKEAGTWEGFDFRKCAKKLLVSTAFSTAGGTMMYAFMHQDEALRFAQPAIEKLREWGVIDAAATTFDTVRHYGAAAMNWAIPGSTDFIASAARKIAESGAVAAATVTNFQYGAVIASAFEGVKERLMGWGTSIKALYSAPVATEIPAPVEVEAFPRDGTDFLERVTGPTVQNDIVIPAQPVLDPLTSEDILAQGDVPSAEVEIVLAEPPVLAPITSEDILAQSEVPAVVADPFEPRIVRTSIVLADGTIVSPEEQARRAAEQAIVIGQRISDAFENLRVPDVLTNNSLTGIYMHEMGIYPETALKMPSVSGDALDLNSYLLGNVSLEATGAIAVEAVEPQNIADAFQSLVTPQDVTLPDAGAYLPELGMYPQTSLQFPPMSLEGFDAPPVYTLGTDGVDVSVANGAGDYVLGTNVLPTFTGTFEENFGSAFEGMDLSSRAERAVEAALSGTDQQQKDLAMNVLNGLGGFDKDPELAARMYAFLLEDTKPAAGERASQTHMQVVRDMAYLMFHGKGIPADPDAARTMLEEIAPRSRVARDMLAEWNGEQVHRAAATVARAASTSGGLNCEFVSAGNRIVSGTCELPADTSLRVGDRISLTP